MTRSDDISTALIREQCRAGFVREVCRTAKCKCIMDRLVLCALILALVPATTHGQYTQDGDPSPFSEAALFSEVASIQPETPFAVGVRLVMDQGWKSYWKNPGDSGEPTEIAWTLPDGFVAGPILWPFPEQIDAGPLRSYGYSDQVFLLTEITPPADLEAGARVQIGATVNWLICADVCLFAEESVSLSLPVVANEPAPSAFAEHFQQARAHLPVTPPGWEVQAMSYSKSFALQVTPPAGFSVDLRGAYFFPAEPLVLEHAVQQPVSREGSSYVFALQQSDYASAPPARLKGVLLARKGQAVDAAGMHRALAVDVPVAATLVDFDQSAAAASPLLLLLLFALIGGLLLNLMPCVFPIVSIKVLGFAQHGGQEPRAMRWHGFVFAGGIIVSFWILSGLLLILRAAGNQIGWGFQLQSPLFVASMAVLFFGIGLSLLGVFEVRAFSPRWVNRGLARRGYPQSFWSGTLATLVATPCTAPFMGAALGAAVVLPPLEAILVFTALGFGMALPYVGLSMMPQLLAKLPKPGPWMETLKHLMAFPMIATTIWLVWVFGNQVGVNGIGLLLVGLLLMGIALWILGRWPAEQLSLRIRLATRSVAAVAVLLSLFTAYQGTQSVAATGPAATEDAAWQAFSLAGRDALRAQGQPVFVDFTATWCLTCQVNKRTTLNSDAVMAAFAQKGVTLMRADWTSRNEEITRALALHGRSGVPLYVLYPGNGSPPAVLPEVLTESIVLNALAALPDQVVASD